MKVMLAIFIALLILLQYQLWFGEGSYRQVWHLRKAIDQQQKENQALKKRNDALQAQVADLHQGHQVVEALARNELGMVKKGETFYQIVEPNDKTQSSKDN